MPHTIASLLSPLVQIDAATVLLDNQKEVEGLVFAGSPATPRFCGVWQVQTEGLKVHVGAATGALAAPLLLAALGPE